MLVLKCPQLSQKFIKKLSLLILTSAASFAIDLCAEDASSAQKVAWGTSLTSTSYDDRQSQPNSRTYSSFSTILAADNETNAQSAPSGNLSNAQAPANNPEAQSAQGAQSQSALGATSQTAPGPVINFNNVNITEFLRFVSRLTGKNFIYDPQQLQFPVTIISETPASLEDVMAALMQNLRVHAFYMIEEGNSFIIHSAQDFKAPGGLLHTDQYGHEAPDIATAVYQIQNVTPSRMAAIIRTMTSKDALVEVIDETLRVVVTDILANINKISDIVKKLDKPNSGLDIGQYVALNNSPAALINVAQRILTPIAADKPLVMVPYQASNSIFIISTPFLVEKTLSILQSLDLNQSKFGLLNIDEMKFDADVAKRLQEQQLAETQRQREIPVPLTQEEIDALTERERNAILQAKGFTTEQISKLSPEQIMRILREKGLSQDERERILGQKKGIFETELPLGQTEATQFFIHKLQFRKAEDVAKALTSIAVSLSGNIATGPGTAQTRNVAPPSDLVVTLNSVQPIIENNSLVFTGTRVTLARVKELVNQIDIPVRQCLIEALVFQTNLQNSLNFGVEWAGKYQMKNYAYSAGLITGPGAGATSVIAGPLLALALPNPTPTVPPTTLQALPLDEGLSGTAIGRKIRHGGTAFRAFASFLNFLRTDNNTEIIVNPKIVAEHNVPAEIFVGQQIPIKGQSIVNSTASNTTNTVATNYETQSVGVDLKVTALISNSDIVTLIIEQSLSNANATQVASQGSNNAPPATVNQTKATTRVHLPSDYFLMMSGMLENQNAQLISTVPGLGGLPIIGFFFNNKNLTEQKNNVIMYIRPRIIDTPMDIERITKSEQRAYEDANERAFGWRKQFNDLKELLNF